MIVTCVVHGNPAPKERVRVTDKGAYTPDSTSGWEEAVGWAYKGLHLFSGPIATRLRFYRCDRRNVDLDNLIKAVLDGLNAVAYGDDSQIVRIEAELHYDRKNPRAEIEIWEMPDEDL